MLWLLSDRLGSLHFLVRPLAALGILVLACLVGMIGYGLDGDLMAQLGIVEFVLLLALVFSMAIAGVLCFKRYGRLRYSLWLLAITFGACLTALVLFGMINLIGSGFSAENVRQMMSMMLLWGLAIAAFLYAIQIVFLTFTLSTPVYRERFCRCLGLRPVGLSVTPPDSSVQTEPTQLPQKQIDPE